VGSAESLGASATSLVSFLRLQTSPRSRKTTYPSDFAGSSISSAFLFEATISISDASIMRQFGCLTGILPEVCCVLRMLRLADRNPGQRVLKSAAEREVITRRISAEWSVPRVRFPRAAPFPSEDSVAHLSAASEQVVWALFDKRGCEPASVPVGVLRGPRWRKSAVKRPTVTASSSHVRLKPALQECWNQEDDTSEKRTG